MLNPLYDTDNFGAYVPDTFFENCEENGENAEKVEISPFPIL